jgi:hypothetical protein
MAGLFLTALSPCLDVFAALFGRLMLSRFPFSSIFPLFNN